MEKRRVVAALLQIEICLRGIWYTRTNAEEVIFGTPEIVEPDIRMSILVEHSRKVSFTLEAPVEVWRDECGGTKLDETKQVSGGDLNAKPGPAELSNPPKTPLAYLVPRLIVVQLSRFGPLRLKTFTRLATPETPAGVVPACGVDCGVAGVAVPPSVSSTRVTAEPLARIGAGVSAGEGVASATCAVQGLGIETRAANAIAIKQPGSKFIVRATRPSECCWALLNS